MPCKKIFLLLLFTCIVSIARANEPQFLILNYHDIVGAEGAKPPFNAMDVSIDHLEEQLAWLNKNGYQIISVQRLLDAAAGKASMPNKGILLTFDDGYQSFYTRVFPLLKKHRYPATIALVGNWMEGTEKPDEPGKQLLSWDQVREIQESGLVEIASHSYDLHHAILANPQGNTQASAVTRQYYKAPARYENDEQYRQRIHQSLQKSSEFIFQHTGIRPRVLVWPFGEYNAITVDAAREAGMSITMELNDGSNTLADLATLRRLIIVSNPVLPEFADMISTQRSNNTLRVAHLDMDYLYDKDPKQTEHNLDDVVKRIKNMQINTVFLQAYSDPDGDGNADALYFPNRHLPVKQDLFNRVAWQLKNVARVKVYAWMPILAYQHKLPTDWYVQEWRDGKAQKSRHIYTRLSPFHPEARQFIGEIYEDLAKHCNFDGILFHDDGILSDYEDASPFALAYTRSVWGLPDQFDKLHNSSQMRMAWAQHKTELINQFTDELTHRVRYYRPYIKTARNMYALPLLKPYSEEWYAQSYDSFLKHYDYVAIEAMPFMEEADDPDTWLTQLVKAAGKHADGINKTVFELQAVNWKTQEKLPMPTFIAQLELLKKLGAIHLGYYPDNVYKDQPRLADIQHYFSLSVSQ
ncbi:MAG: poly-beta-1,6-N-acetyl-D-glucosamine N-deacetylase PgaB [Methylococcaceae bacterium]|nr:poly-beta-1,6-N-acetyl-D-glucosamine N-deacetylase PgaB [Methylococcaceae bacterium]